jgi:hypothetical protein
MEFGPFVPEWLTWVDEAGIGVAAAGAVALAVVAALARIFEAVFDLDPH